MTKSKSNSRFRQAFISILIVAIICVFSAPVTAHAASSTENLSTSSRAATDEIVGIEVRDGTGTRNYTVGDEFKANFRLFTKKSNGRSSYVSDKENIVVTGYDMSKAGTQTVTVTYKGFSTTYEIVVKNVVAAIKSRALDQYDFVYNGEPAEPNVILKDANGNIVDSSNYDVTYEDNVNVGTAMAVVSYKGDYAGKTKTYLAFRIAPKGTAITKINPKAKKLVLKIKPQKTQTTGYEIKYSLKKNMVDSKTLKVANAKSSVTLSKLKSKKTYYIQIRTYKVGKLNGRDYAYNSAWSKVYSGKTK